MSRSPCAIGGKDLARSEAPRRGPLATLFLGRPRTRKHHFDALDGLRGMAVLIVIASHLSLAGMDLVPFLSLAGIGKSGVYLFFVLSAFLLTRALLERTPAEFSDSRLWANYALRRVLRIWPLYLTILLLSWALTRAGVAGWYYQMDTAELVRHLMLLEGQSVLWSIPVEFKFYLWLPLVAFGLAWMSVRGWPLYVQLAVALLALGLATYTWPPGETGRNDVRLGPYLVLFLCGAFTAAVDRRIGDACQPAIVWAVLGVAALGAAALSIPEVWAKATASEVDRRLSHTWFLFFGLVWSALLLSVLRGPRWLRKPFAWGPARLLGVVSFSAYLWHMPVLFTMRAIGAHEWTGAPVLVLLATTLVAMGSFLLFERPWQNVRLPHARERLSGSHSR